MVYHVFFFFLELTMNVLRIGHKSKAYLIQAASILDCKSLNLPIQRCIVMHLYVHLCEFRSSKE